MVRCRSGSNGPNGRPSGAPLAPPSTTRMSGVRRSTATIAAFRPISIWAAPEAALSCAPMALFLKGEGKYRALESVGAAADPGDCAHHPPVAGEHGVGHGHDAGVRRRLGRASSEP